MVLTNVTITIFNRFADREQKKFVYVPHVLADVWFHAKQVIRPEQGGMVSANDYRIRIPFPRDGWLPPNDFKDLVDAGDYWTVQDKDFFMVGVWDGGSVNGMEEIKKKFSGTAGVILNHSENFFGSSQHIRIGGGD